jgi:hypothetical protein
MKVFIVATMLCACISNANAGIEEMFKQLEEVIGQGTAIEHTENAEAELDKALEVVEVGPNGIEVDCKSMRRRSEGDDFNIKSSAWTEETVSFLNQKVESCRQLKINTASEKYPGRIDSANMDADWTKLAIKNHYDSALIQRESQRKSDEADQKSLAQSQCQATDSYALYRSQNAAVDYHAAVQDITDMQKAEREITQESGVRDLALERNLTIKLRTFRELRDRNFKRYRELGGKAASVQKVTKEIQNPCS